MADAYVVPAKNRHVLTAEPWTAETVRLQRRAGRFYRAVSGILAAGRPGLRFGRRRVGAENEFHNRLAMAVVQ